MNFNQNLAKWLQTIIFFCISIVVVYVGLILIAIGIAGGAIAIDPDDFWKWHERLISISLGGVLLVFTFFLLMQSYKNIKWLMKDFAKGE